MNFGESLAYWYFRLNGFFVLPNFVLHHPNPLRKETADVDLLAVRFPHVFEKIGGQLSDWDNARFAQWGVDHDRQIVCVLCEVKTGYYAKEAVRRSFDPDRMEYAVRRIGVLPKGAAAHVCEQLARESVVHRGNHSFVKVLMARANRQRSNLSQGRLATASYCTIDLEEAIGFIRQRMERYRPEKMRGRMFFPSELIQYLAWEAGVQIDDEILEEDR
ncbi:MAG: hypothetical protein WD847_18585 [Pirellulales bacterium]